jgi:hypothetical protein
MVYFVVAVLLLALGVLTIFSIGAYLILVALAMVAVAWARGRRPWIVEGTIVGAVVFVISHFLTAPLSCSASGDSGINRASCERIALPDLHAVDVSAASWLALGIALTVGVAAGTLVARYARRRPGHPVA